MKEYLQNIIREAAFRVLRELSITDVILPSFLIEPPKNHDLGDWTSSIAFTIAKYAKKSPQEIGERIRDKINDIDNKLIRIDVLSGYLNFFLNPMIYPEILKQIMDEKDHYGHLDIGKGKRVLLEFVSANPTGPLHVGHGRGAVFGDALSRILRHAGYDVVNEYYINDAGNQVYSMGRSIESCYFKHFGIDREAGEYSGDYINQIAQELIKEAGDRYINEDREKINADFTDFGVKRILNLIREDLEKLNIKMDSWVSEKELFKSGKVDEIIERLKRAGYTKEEDNAVWFRSSEFGDDKDRVLIKGDGEKTYFASDIAYHNEKFSRGFDIYINIWGADHHGYLPRLKASLTALGHDVEKLKVIFVQMVRLTRGGKPLQMSKRSGEYITLKELIDEVKPDATRFFFLMREPDSGLNFDIDLARRQTSENPVYYVQYAHARICSIFREADSKRIPVPRIQDVDLSELDHPDEIRIIRYLIHFRDEVERSARTLSAHNITYYLIELANEFHKYYNNHRVLDEDKKIRDARMVLVNCVKIIISTGLKLLGISAPEEM